MDDTSGAKMCMLIGPNNGAALLPHAKVRVALDQHQDPTGEKASRAEFARIILTRINFHGHWNYAYHPR